MPNIDVTILRERERVMILIRRLRITNVLICCLISELIRFKYENVKCNI